MPPKRKAAKDAEDKSDQTKPPRATRGRKRAAAASEDVAEEDAAPKTKTRTKKGGQSKSAVIASQSKTPPLPQSDSVVDDASAPKKSPTFGEAQIAKPEFKIELDELCPLTTYEVYIDEKNVIYDASLNQTNAGNNNNKFYRVQLLRNVSGDYKTWTRWGRVGDRGQTKILGDGSFANALTHFEKKFKEKSGLSWAQRGNDPKAGKYTFVERSYAPDTDEEDGSPDGDEAGPDSKLAPAIQDLMELIFNQQYFANAMSDMNYDVKKLPLGKLSKNTITRGYQALKDLSALLDNPALADDNGETFDEATESLSNSYFSLIPHAFGRSHPPVIRDHDTLKKEIELLDSLSDMKAADGILKKQDKDEERLNKLDRQFQGLGLDEMTSLQSNSTEYRELSNYLMGTRGSTHNANYQISHIFRIERHGEKERFDGQFSSTSTSRRLLWHGSRCTNFGGILSQGLRIAPPEAPVSGYMFGKGIYLADMSSKSANYCCPYNSNGHALLLLCEVELGDPMHELTGASYTAGDDAHANGMLSTWGKGTTGPKLWKDAGCVHPSLKGVQMPDAAYNPGNTGVKGAYLLYNEYIAYDVAQVRLRYLFRVRM